MMRKSKARSEQLANISTERSMHRRARIGRRWNPGKNNFEGRLIARTKERYLSFVAGSPGEWGRDSEEDSAKLAMSPHRPEIRDVEYHLRS